MPNWQVRFNGGRGGYTCGICDLLVLTEAGKKRHDKVCHEREPITLDDYILASALFYPTLYMDPFADPSVMPVTRRKILDHMYFVIGNGLDWQPDGTLREDFCDEYKCDPKVVKAIHEGGDALLKLRRKVAKDHVRFVNSMRRPIKGFSLKPVKVNKDGLFDFNTDRKEYIALLSANKSYEGLTWDNYEPYPFRGPGKEQFCALAEIPDNVRPDFLAGAFEALQNVLDHYHRVIERVPNRPMPNPLVDQVAEQKESAKAWIKHLEERFGPQV